MPRKLGPYELRSELGRGAMAQVWRAYDAVLDREVALKEPLLPQGVDITVATEYAARFVREGRAAAKLSHPNIVTIHAADIYDGRAALVMELVEGQTLGELLSRGPLDQELALSVMEQLLSAVGYAHARGIVHRDIKPDNIFVTPDGRVKLADFGIASLATDATLTQAGTIMGTPGYMAPEQITGEPVDARADLFALGVLFYEMLTGHNPFGASEGLPTTTIMYRIVHQAPPELPSGALAGLPVDIRPVLQVAMAKDPADRFIDAGSFLAALKGEGPLPMPGAYAAQAAGPRAGTMMARAAMIKQKTMFGRPAGAAGGSSWLHSWLPYALVAGIGLIVMIALLATSGGGGSGSGVTAGSSDSTASSEALNPSWTIIGQSAQGRDINLCSVGSGSWRVLVIGGMHGDEQGAALAGAFVGFLDEHPEVVPTGTSLRVIPNVNPDGSAADTRGNANAVDLNRNFPSQNWQSQLNSKDAASHTCWGGSSPGSEPETQAVLSCLAAGFDLVIVLYSRGNSIDYGGGVSGLDVATRMASAGGMQLKAAENQPYITGSLGLYVPEYYAKPIITMVAGGSLTPPVKAALLAALTSN